MRRARFKVAPNLATSEKRKKKTATSNEAQEGGGVDDPHLAEKENSSELTSGKSLTVDNISTDYPVCEPVETPKDKPDNDPIETLNQKPVFDPVETLNDKPDSDPVQVPPKDKPGNDINKTRFKSKFRPNLPDRGRKRTISGSRTRTLSESSDHTAEKSLTRDSSEKSIHRDASENSKAMINHDASVKSNATHHDTSQYIIQHHNEKSKTTQHVEQDGEESVVLQEIEVEEILSPDGASVGNGLSDTDSLLLSPSSCSSSLSGRIRRRRATDGIPEIETMFDKRKAEHKRRFHKGVPERSKMTVFDFIFHNPSDGSRMSRRNSSASSTEDGPNKANQDEIVEDLVEEENVSKTTGQDPEAEEEQDDTAMPVPQVKIGPDGQIILDEDSTFIETTASKKAKEDLMKTPLIFESQNTNYGTWSKRRKNVEWSEKETLRFYKALSIFGTDFSMMSSIFKKRSRHDLKMKFKKEEKINRQLVDRCLSQNGQFDLSSIQDFDEDDPDDPSLTADKGKTNKKRKKPTNINSAAKRRKRTKSLRKSRGYYSSSSENDDADVESEVETTTRKSVDSLGSSVSSSSQPEQPMLQSILSQPTAEFPPGLLAANPGLANAHSGSLVVVAAPSASSNLHVYMVRDEGGGGGGSGSGERSESKTGRVRTISGTFDRPTSPALQKKS